MNMQQLVIQAQKMQRELQKKQAELEAKEFTVSKGGAVTVVVKGDKTVKTIDIDKDALDPENKEMIEEMIALAINEAVETITEESNKIQEQMTGKTGLF